MDFIKENTEIFIGIVLGVINIVGWVWNKFDKAYKFRKKADSYIEMINNHSKQIDAMDVRHGEDYQKLDGKLDTIIDSIQRNQEENKIHNDKQRRAIIEQMSSDITKACECYLERKSIESYELTALINQFTVYKEIGGNHGVHELVDKVRELTVEHKHK